jgi:uncharacterized membrane protein YfhO
VLSDSWYPGWRATVDGREARIERADLHFRAVYLEAGTHRVEFAYRPMSYLIGLGITGITLAAVVVGLAAMAIRRRVLRKGRQVGG